MLRSANVEKPVGQRIARGLSIRSKLLLLVLALLLIPWMGYYYAQELKQFLLKGQEEALLLTARGIATVLHDRTELFDPATGVPELVGEERSSFVNRLSQNIRLDGDDKDWITDSYKSVLFNGLGATQCSVNYDPDSFSYKHTFGYRGANLFALFHVWDETLVYRDLNFRRLDNSDHIRVVLQNPQQPLQHYLVTARRPGRMSVYRVDDNWRYPLTGDPVYDITAVMSDRADGYTVELRIPRHLMKRETRIGFSVVDVDNEATREVERTIAAMPTGSEDSLSRIMILSPELVKILEGLNRPVARIWILDTDQHVRAVVGEMTGQPGAYNVSQRAPLRAWLVSVFDPVLDLFFATPESDFMDVPLDVGERQGEIFTRVLAGESQAQRRPSIDGRAEILMAAFPIFSGERVLGAVLVEQSSNEILALQQIALKNLTIATILVFVFVATAMLLFASNLTLRIARLRTSTELAITPEGRVQDNNIPVATSTHDEVGDLSRSITNMLKRLSQYTRYLEAMPDTLAHELSNPLNVVNSSLENLEIEIPDSRNSKYMARAKNGIVRLRSILTSLTEAANLEDALQTEEQEKFDFVELVTGCVDGYKVSNPDRKFDLDIIHSPLLVLGSADHLAQMLDKLADNAVDFSDPDTTILVRLQRANDKIALSITNEGPLLPEAMKDRLFDPMISVGKKKADKSHLGLGLFITRLITQYHKGEVSAANKGGGSGVEITITLPLAT